MKCLFLILMLIFNYSIMLSIFSGSIAFLLSRTFCSGCLLLPSYPVFSPRLAFLVGSCLHLRLLAPVLKRLFKALCNYFN